MRSRNIKPGFFENEQLAELPFEARILFIGLWCYADRKGRFEWRPKRIKALIFPYDEIDVECHLMSLHVMTLILQYKSGSDLYGFIPNFEKHQKPHPHEAKSVLPDPQTCELVTPKHSLSKFENVKNNQLNQCHDMSLNVTKCNSDIMIPDITIPPPIPPRGENGAVAPRPANGTPVKHEKIPFREIIEYLNEKSKKSFRWQTGETQRQIKARWNAGFRVDDFKRVIDNKCAKWLTDPKMIDYVRPATLFGTKFEAYLNETKADNPSSYWDEP